MRRAIIHKGAVYIKLAEEEALSEKACTKDLLSINSLYQEQVGGTENGSKEGKEKTRTEKERNSSKVSSSKRGDGGGVHAGDAESLRRSSRPVAHIRRILSDLGDLVFRSSHLVTTDISKRVKPKYQKAVAKAVKRLALQPFPHDRDDFGKFKDGATLWRTRATKEYRLFYTVHAGEIRALGIRPKDKNTYKNLEEFQTRYDEMDQEE